MTDAWDDEDRAIARALGAEVPEGEAAPAPDPAALAEYEAVLAALPFEAVAPRPELENEMVATALARRPAAARAIGSAPSSRRRAVSPRWIATGMAVAAAAAIAVALAVGGTATGPASPGGRIAPAAATGSVARVLAEAGTRTGVLHAPDGATTGKVALGTDGQGFLYDLPPSTGTARWLWLDAGSEQVLVGRLGDASTVHFVVSGDVNAVRRVLVTTERGTPATPGPVQSVATLSPAR
jgi:hypothetical protein